MTIDCAFKGHTQRASSCEKQATSFFQSAKGTLWPLCPSCADQHKKLIMVLAKKLPSAALAGATFDLPLDDADLQVTYASQDPSRIDGVIRRVDAEYTELLEQYIASRGDA